MPTYSFNIISNAFLVFNSGTGAFDFSASYTPSSGRYRIDVTDDDATMNSGGDANQFATVYDMAGNVIASGVITVPAYAEISLPGGGFAYLDRIEIDGVHYGYLPSTNLAPGTSYPVTTSGTFQEQHTYYQTNSVPCFGPGTSIATASGMVATDQLEVGDLVQTLDRGMQPIRWIGRAQVSPKEWADNANLGPVRVVGPGKASLWLSANHGVLLRSACAELHLGEAEVICAAKHMADYGGQWPGSQPITYTHVLFDQHELINANGIWVESLFPGPAALAALPLVLRRQVNAVLGHAAPMRTARPVLTSREARLLLHEKSARRLAA